MRRIFHLWFWRRIVRIYVLRIKPVETVGVFPYDLCLKDTGFRFSDDKAEGIDR